MRRLFAVVVCALFVLPVMAQRGSVGVKTGINLSTVHFAGASDAEVDSKAGWVIGVFGELKKPGRGVGLQAEILYSREGYETEYDYHDVKMRLNYINIPILVKIYPVEFLSFDLGYQAGILWNAVEHTKRPRGTGGENEDIAGIRSVNNSLVLGLTFRLGSHVDLSARYNLGLSDLENKQEGDMIRSRVGQFTLGYRF